MELPAKIQSYQLIDKEKLPFKVNRLIWLILKKILCAEQINELYANVNFKQTLPNVIEEILAQLNITLSFDQNKLTNIPTEGPLIILSNHPFGGLDGLILASLLTKSRSRVKILANYFLGLIPGLAELFIVVDPFNIKSSKNISGLKAIIKALQGDNAIILFPSGTVSHLHLLKRSIQDPQWHPNTAAIIRKTRATVLPIYIEGHNGWLFQLMGIIHPYARTLLLPRALIHKKNCKVDVQIGDIIPYEKYASYNDDVELINYFRMQSDKLKRLGE